MAYIYNVIRKAALLVGTHRREGAKVIRFVISQKVSNTRGSVIAPCSPRILLAGSSGLPGSTTVREHQVANNR